MTHVIPSSNGADAGMLAAFSDSFNRHDATLLMAPTGGLSATSVRSNPHE